MSTTTQILFNSPALHSLKRDQLVKLCKIHSIKASGKNVDLVERLKNHAQTLPPDDPLSVAVRSDNEDSDRMEDEEENKENDNGRWKMPRPSEAWSLMESIEEEGSSGGTMSSTRTMNATGAAGEFGTGGSKGSSVSSSIKALATSLGIKRAPSTKSTMTSQASQSSLPSSSGNSDELTRYAMPYSSLPPSDPDAMPQTDHFKFSTPDTSFTEPIPGEAHLPGQPAPENARLSSGGGTTIRLVSHPVPLEDPMTPQLRPFTTTYDLIAGTPGVGRINIWPSSPTGGERIYPSIPMFDDPMSPNDDDDVEMPGALNTSPPAQATDIFSPGTSKQLAPPTQPFVFGSPLPQHNLSNKQFRTAATSVLEEMNKRLAGAGVEQVSIDVLDRSKRPASEVDLTARPAADERFGKAHEQVFSKMDSIATHYAAKRASPDKKRKSSALGVGDGRRGPSGKRKSNASGARVISNGTRKHMIPGAFGEEEDDEEDEGDRRSSKRPRVADDAGPSEPKRVSIAPAAGPREDANDDAEKKKQKEREAIKRKLDMNKARRRSSMGRVSVGGGKAPLIPNQKAKGSSSRFGFLSSAKSIVANVWNRGGSSKGAAGSSIPVSKAPVTKPAPAEEPKPNKLAKKPSISSAHPSTAKPADATTRIPSSGSTSNRTLKPPSTSGSVRSNQPPRSRSPIPAFGSTSTRSSAINSLKPPSANGTGNSRYSTRPSSIAGASSMGTRTGGKSGSNVSSIGTRTSLVSNSGVGSTGVKRSGSTVGSMGDKGSLRTGTSSRLLAPTASSLAKAQGSVRLSAAHSQEHIHGRSPGLASVAEQRSRPTNAEASSSKPALDQITNSPRPAGTPLHSPRPGPIFSKPLTAPGSSIPTPVRNQTFGAAASTLADTKPLVLAPKPKALAGRKPRISRSKVIARLASQRAAPSAEAAAGRTRSSMGAAVRQSAGRKSGGGRRSGGAEVLMSAKKRARQSEYARRRSRAGAGSAIGLGGGAMNIDS